MIMPGYDKQERFQDIYAPCTLLFFHPVTEVQPACSTKVIHVLFLISPSEFKQRSHFEYFNLISHVRQFKPACISLYHNFAVISVNYQVRLFVKPSV